MADDRDRKLLLIVDDEERNCELLAAMVESFGHDWAVARDGHEALAMLRLDVDLILLDVMMPGMSGFDVCNILRDFPETRTTPIIFLTAVAEMPRKIMGLRLGANDYITKPFDLRELTARVEVVLRTTVGSTQEVAGSDAGPTAVVRG